MAVNLVTSHGTMLVRLHYKECPKTCRNFIELAKHGYYDGVIFHRVIPGFVAQTGDPFGDGHGGESIYGPEFEDENVARLSHNRKGVVSMANRGRNTNSLQFSSHSTWLSTLTVSTQFSGTCRRTHWDPAVKVKNKKPLTTIKIFTAEVIEDPWKAHHCEDGSSDEAVALEFQGGCLHSWHQQGAGRILRHLRHRFRAPRRFSGADDPPLRCRIDGLRAMSLGPSERRKFAAHAAASDGP